MSTSPTTEPQPSSLSTAAESDLTSKQQRILAYLREAVDSQTYFKSRLIADELDMSAKEVGANMTPLVEGDIDLSVEKWGYSSGTTWMVTA
jgi:DNA-binding MarR family transcriptional regulator